MTAAHHPREEHWLDYASGQVGAPLRNLLESHLAFCAPCRELAARSAIGGALLLAQPASEPAPAGLLQGILAHLPVLEPPRVGVETLPIPARLWPLLPDLRHSAWHGALTPGFRYLEAEPGLFLIHMKKGRPFPEHGHGGREYAVILCGGLRDGEVLLEAGDFDEVLPNRVHSPVALPDEDCWLLAAQEGSLRFTGWRGWLQRLAGQGKAL